ncbi:DgyrCDS1795 [Dimorphilus gyrociliatus]|uniref:DnaJ homolog subfamily C member 17 n=1 Tax=Dimorphilus gyrociliatus TaxID=2664684 RepID=A0A7I8V8G4_9ANNE|nr:DgyrCDS1795 [Dimorphilus gyrociliatus]
MAEKKKSDLLKIDLYEFLGISHDATSKEILKNYRKKALECHPDKNPDDPKAAEKFHKLTEALEILTDENAKAAYDKVLQARKAAEIRDLKLNAERRKLKRELEAREEAYLEKRNIPSTANLEKEIDRLREQGSKIVEEEQRLLREKIKNIAAGKGIVKNYNPLGTQCYKINVVVDEMGDEPMRIKVSWREGYDEESIKKIFSAHGEINEMVILLKKKKSSAIIEFLSIKSSLAVEKEVGLPNCGELTVEWLSGKPKDQPPVKIPKFDNFEDHERYVLECMREAGKRQKLLKKDV